MKLLALFLAASLLPAQTPVRRSIAPSPTNGWARVVVDDDGAEGVWIGDAEGRSVPFLWESDAKWSAIPLRTLHPVFGKDAQGHPTAAFTLHAPEGFSRGDREQVKLDFALEASATPWTCRVEIARRGDGGAFITLDDESRFLYDFGSDRRATSITVPWDSDDYRVTLLPVQGAAPKLRGVDASACTLPGDLNPDSSIAASISAGEKQKPTSYLIYDIGDIHRVIGVDVRLQPPSAPMKADIFVEKLTGMEGLGMPYEVGSAEIWNLPALGTVRTRIPLDFTSSQFELGLPLAAIVQSATALIRHRRLFFPAEAGQAYFLHTGGLAKTAPGSLGELPASSRAFYAGAPLALGPAESDPQAVTPTPDPVARLRRLLPWAVGLLILLLGFWGLRLMRRPDLH